MVTEHRRRGDEVAQGRILAVENAHGIALEPAQALLVERGSMAREVLNQGLLVAGARFGRPKRVHLECDAANPELAPQPRRDDDELRVDLGLAESQRLHAQLMELSITALLRLFRG